MIKNMLKKLLVIFLLCLPLFAVAQEKVNVSVFVREGCAHCEDEKVFLVDLQKDFSQISVRYYDIGEVDARDLFNAITEKYALTKGTPITLIDGQLVQGFDTSETTGVLLRQLITSAQNAGSRFEDILNGGANVLDVATAGPSVCEDGKPCSVETGGFFVTIPLINKTINAGNLSLSALSLVLGFIDGFNPCAMWVLVMFLIILTQLQSRKKMLQYAGLFILAEAIMYYFILNVWLTAWDFIGLNNFIVPAVGILAVGSGIYFLYKFATYTEVCAVAGVDQRKRITQRVKELASNPMTFGVALGILGLAFSVNIFEFACSIGIPQTFTKVLELNSVSWLMRQGYMFLYMAMYLVDDLVVFGVALYSIDKIGITHKYSKWSTLVGGVLMIILGIIMLTKPGLLIF